MNSAYELIRGCHWLEQDEEVVDRIIFGFSKRKIIYDVKNFLCLIESTIGRENKIVICRALFTYLATADCKKFIQNYDNFRNVLKNKLMEFRYKENLREAQRWWRDIFETRIPIES